METLVLEILVAALVMLVGVVGYFLRQLHADIKELAHTTTRLQKDISVLVVEKRVEMEHMTHRLQKLEEKVETLSR